MSPAHDFIRFAAKSPTAFHAVAHIAARLDAAGYVQLRETQPFALAPGGKYYLIRNGSSLVAFRLPRGGFDHFQIVASHADSPMFKLKPEAECEQAGYLRLNVEGYGGMIMSTWLDRPLGLAGRLIVREGNALVPKLVDLGRDAVLIPSLAIHLNREVNKGYAFNPQVDLLPLVGEAQDKGWLLRALSDAAGVAPEAVAARDVFLYARVPGSVWGAKDAYFSCGRIDDLECAYTSLVGFLAAKEAEGHTDVYALFDNEEVGSGSRQGADSTLLSDVLMRICAASGIEAASAISGSFMLSADNAHAVHPNHPEKYDETNRCRMNGGVVLKHNAAQKYTTDAASDAVFAALCERAGVPVQRFTNRSDMAGGSTLGHIAITHASMATADIGLAQLAMHSSYETAGCLDIDYMTRALKVFHETNVSPMAGDGWQLT